ncbi:fibronectin type III domain-containing protein [Actinomadura sp. WMMA1423]|uniref:fibronectin type III domain-containing protein n=1 Tax=Actinomadura sp. WMMA1423 TaxID=2591108 RepID=UPI001146D24A|nr:fibronectin type III domain-containing protein [Actinomadura sp. WMMA1423]
MGDMSALKVLFRRDRLTGQVAIGLTGVVIIAAVAYGVGVASAKYRLAEVGAWLAADRKGALVHANGPAAKVDGKAALPAQMRGHNIKIVQDGTTVLLVDQTTGVVSRLDPAQLNVGASRPLGQGLQVIADAGKAYTVDSVKGVLQQIDPISLTPVGASATLTPVLGQAGIDARGALWVPVAGNGQVTAFKDGKSQPPVKTGRPGDDLALTIAAGDPVVVNSTAATATVVKPSGTPLTVALPATVKRAGRGGVLAPPATEGRTVPLLVPGAGSLVTVDTDTGRYSSTRLAMPKHRYRPPQMLGAKVYIPDETAGALLVYDSAGNRFEPPVPVAGRPARLDVFVRDGLLWANDPSGSRAVVIDGKGDRKGIDKYRDKVPGGAGRRTLPQPGGGDAPPPSTSPPDVPLPSANPQEPRRPRPGEPPSAPANVSVTPGAGTMRIDFQPSQGEGVLGYVLKGVPPGLTASPSAITPGAGPFTFTVSGGDCGSEYQFRVAVRYRDGTGRTREQLSAPSDPARPCVTPGAPTGLTAQATASGTKVSWTAPSGASSYRLTWDGPVTGATTVNAAAGSAVSTTLGNVWTNGSYTFSVAAVNGAGTGTAARLGTRLTGPAAKYPVERNGKSDAYIRSVADANNSGATIATMTDNNGELVVVNCQKKGVSYTHPRDSSLTGDMYANITWSGKTGYVIGYLVNTPGDWKSFAGPAVWKCEP